MAPDSCASGGSGSTGSSTAPPARARLGEEDPATIRFDSISPSYTLGCNLTFREMLRANPDQMAMLKQNNPKLSEALESGDLEAFAKVLKEQQDARKEREQMRIRLELLSHTHWNQDLRLQEMINW